MASTITKQRTLTRILNCHESNGDAPAADLPVLEQFIFALCRENATSEQAQLAYAKVKTSFFDWNEVRVSTVREIEEAMAGLSDTESRAHRLIALLQEVFETTFSFDLDGLQKKGVKQAAKALTRYGAANDYVSAWVIQRTLGGHAIPVDQATLRCSRRLNLVDAEVEDVEAARAGLEHLVPKAKGSSFTDALSVIAEEFCWEDEPKCPDCPLLADCPTGQENRTAELATARTARAKPR